MAFQGNNIDLPNLRLIVSWIIRNLDLAQIWGLFAPKFCAWRDMLCCYLSCWQMQWYVFRLAKLSRSIWEKTPSTRYHERRKNSDHLHDSFRKFLDRVFGFRYDDMHGRQKGSIFYGRNLAELVWMTLLRGIGTSTGWISIILWNTLVEKISTVQKYKLIMMNPLSLASSLSPSS